MRSSRLTAALAVMSLPLLGAFAALAPAKSAAANEIPGDIASRMLPKRSVEPSASSPSLSDYKIPATATEVAPPTLFGLVAQYAGVAPTDQNMKCLAAAVYFEAKTEALNGQLAVAQTILNRTRSGRFPTSVCGVVFQPRQFSFVRGRAFPAIKKQSRHWQNALAIAHIATHNLWDSTVNDALYFHARQARPGWRMERIAAVGNHVFYR